MNNVFWGSDHIGTTPPSLHHPETLILGMSFKLQFLFYDTIHFEVIEGIDFYKKKSVTLWDTYSNATTTAAQCADNVNPWKAKKTVSVTPYAYYTNIYKIQI